MSLENCCTGIYVHIPFCVRKCPYCDFYSVAANEEKIDEYTSALCRKIKSRGINKKRCADTLYFGGGTPSVIGAKRLLSIKNTVQDFYDLKNAEITVEVNPAKTDFDFALLRENGFNRVSIGLQSANDNELELLGRLHNSVMAERCIKRARSVGFENISLDLMIATPKQTESSLERSIEFCAEHNAAHISAYILKTEEGTPYFEMRSALDLPNDDEQAEMYLFACEKIKEYGFKQYEISNFCREGFESRHNLKYWHDEEYIGFGPSAHSFLDGKRFYYGKSFEDFYADKIIDDGEGGDVEEFIMLGLRLSEGITNERFFNRFGYDIPEKYFERAVKLEKLGIAEVDRNRIRFTRKGFLVSNAAIAEILR